LLRVALVARLKIHAVEFTQGVRNPVGSKPGVDGKLAADRQIQRQHLEPIHVAG
jgi:hypothetical protein